MMKIKSILGVVALSLALNTQADFATGFSTGLLLGSLGDSESEIDKTIFLSAKTARLKTAQALNEKILKAETGEYFRYVKLAYSQIAQHIQEGKTTACISTGHFNTESNNLLLNRRYVKIDAFLSHFENQGYSIKAEKHNSLCFSW